jgi:hypothetical protein
MYLTNKIFIAGNDSAQRGFCFAIIIIIIFIETYQKCGSIIRIGKIF